MLPLNRWSKRKHKQGQQALKMTHNNHNR